MKKIFDNYIKITSLSSIVFIILGLLLIINPKEIIDLISDIVGVICMAFGVFEIIYYSKTTNHSSLVIGIFSLVAGVILLANPNIFASIIPIIIGLAIIIQSVQKLEMAVSFKEQKIKEWIYMFISAAIMLVFGIIFVANPITGAVITTQIIGILILVYSIMSITNNIMFRKKFKEINKIIDQID